MAITDHGQTLRFYKASQVRLNAEVIREFLKEEGWRNTEPWNSSFAPGGSKYALFIPSSYSRCADIISSEYIMHYFALVMQKIYNVLVQVPRWVLMLLSGVIGNFIIKLMHKDDTKKETEKKDDTPAASTSTVTEASATGVTPAKGKGKQRKVAKK